VRKFSVKKKAAAIGLAAGIALGAGGVAFAYFTSTGTGTGSVKVGSATNFTVVKASTSGTLYPGATTASVTFTITNPGHGHQNAASVSSSVVTKTGDITSGGSKVAGCLSTWFTTANAFTPVNLAPGGHTSAVVTVTMHTTTVTQNPCQGKTPNINLTVTS
jgi:hypothetical protein